MNQKAKPVYDAWHVKFAANSDAIERWTKVLLRAANKLEKLRAERKRMLKPAKGRKALDRKLEDIPQLAAGGNEFNDELPI